MASAPFGAEPILDERTDAGFRHLDAQWPDGVRHPPARPAAPDEAFGELRVGPDHVGFGGADGGELEKWATRLDELGIEHGGIMDAPYGSGLSFRDPDGIALEFFAPPNLTHIPCGRRGLSESSRRTRERRRRTAPAARTRQNARRAACPSSV